MRNQKPIFRTGFFLVLTSLYLGSCGNSLSSPPESPEASAVLTVYLTGTGQPDLSPRTLAPQALSGKYLRLTFTPETEGLEPVQAETDTSSLIVPLPPGAWTIQAQGWNSKGDWETAPEEIILRGAGRVQVTAGEVLGTQVLLYPVGTGTGVLSYTLQVPGDTVSALLRVYPLPENPDSVSSMLDLYAGKAPGQAEGTLVLQGSLELPGGFYRAALDLSRQTGDQVLVLRKNDTVHIYDSLTTTGTDTFRPEQFVPGDTFTDVAALETYLAGLPENTPDTPYLISLKVQFSATTPLFQALSRYVALDLRESTPDKTISNGPQSSANARYLVSLSLPEGIETLGDYAVSSCSSLEYVSLPESLKTIGNSAFRYSGFSSIRIPQGVQSLGSLAFGDNPNLQSIDLSGLTLESLGDRVFGACSSLEQVILPSALPGNTVPGFMFYRCTALESLNLPQDIETIGFSAFYDCSALSSLELPGRIKTIGNGAFSGCSKFNPDLGSLAALETIDYGAFQNTGLSQVRLAASITAIGSSAFRGCTSLTLATIPESLALLIDYTTFAYCRDLQFKVGDQEPSPLLIGNGTLRAYPAALGEASLPEGIREILNQCFAGNTGITSLRLPASLETIGSMAFQNCRNLVLLTLPENSQLTHIGVQAFQNTKIQSITLPTGIADIDDQAFYGCSDLKELVCRASTPPDLGTLVFTNTHADLKIYVPDASVAAYQGASNWSDFASVISGLSARP